MFKVVDESNSPVGMANILLKNKQKIVFGGGTDSNGLRRFKKSGLEYFNRIEISFIGYETIIFDYHSSENLYIVALRDQQTSFPILLKAKKDRLYFPNGNIGHPENNEVFIKKIQE